MLHILLHSFDFPLLFLSVLHIDSLLLVSGYWWSPRPNSAWILISRSANYLPRCTESLACWNFCREDHSAFTRTAIYLWALQDGRDIDLLCIGQALREGLRKNRSPLCLPKQMKNNQCVRAGEMFSKFKEVTQPERKHLLHHFWSAQKV